MGYFYICFHTFILSDLFTKSMEFCVQKNNTVFFNTERRGQGRGQRGEEEKLNQKQMKTRVTAPKRPSELLLITHLGTPLPRKDPLVMIPESSLLPPAYSPGTRFLWHLTFSSGLHPCALQRRGQRTPQDCWLRPSPSVHLPLNKTPRWVPSPLPLCPCGEAHAVSLLKHYTSGQLGTI